MLFMWLHLSVFRKYGSGNVSCGRTTHIWFQAASGRCRHYKRTLVLLAYSRREVAANARARFLLVGRIIRKLCANFLTFQYRSEILLYLQLFLLAHRSIRVKALIFRFSVLIDKAIYWEEMQMWSNTAHPRILGATITSKTNHLCPKSVPGAAPLPLLP